MLIGSPYVAEVDYLESDGTQWIDTGVPLGPGLSISMRLWSESASTSVGANGPNPFGAIDYYTYKNESGRIPRFFGIIQNNVDFRMYYGDTDNNHILKRSNSSLAKRWFTVKCGRNWLEGDALDTQVIKLDQAENSESDVTMTIFGRKKVSKEGVEEVKGMCAYKMSTVKIYKNDVCVRNFVPMRIGTTGYMFDRVTRQFYGKATPEGVVCNDFKVGPDTANHIISLHKYGDGHFFRMGGCDLIVHH